VRKNAIPKFDIFVYCIDENPKNEYDLISIIKGGVMAYEN
jgi:hypothetical protein